jgi:hypothetical protein
LQPINEGTKDKSINDEKQEAMLTEEIEIDSEGNKTIVKEQITPMDQSLKYQMKIVIGMKMKV